MLVLSRKVEERIYVSGPCVLRVTRIGPNTVKLAIAAERETAIIREELADDDQQRLIESLAGPPQRAAAA